MSTTTCAMCVRWQQIPDESKCVGTCSVHECAYGGSALACPSFVPKHSHLEPER